jgi:DtxR family transcriptional regulator, Mn-dependent transcriptional regulator
MERTKEKEEYLEILWYMKERNSTLLDELKAEVGGNFRTDLIDELRKEGSVDAADDYVALTEKGTEYTRQLIRSHRLAERLVHDVLGVEYEKDACEFEHIINIDLVDSICTLLGHPRECPHGMLIPEGECCRKQTQTVESSVVPITQVEVGDSAKIAYVYAKNDQQMHKLDNLLLRPGVSIKLHQRYPSFVIECENTVIAIDEQVASNIYVWLTGESARPLKHHGRRKSGRGFRHGV